MRINFGLVKKSSNKWSRLIPGIFISAVSLVIVFYFIDMDRLIQAVRLADYRYIALLLCMSLLWLAVRSIVWRTLLCEQATFSQVFLTVNEGYLLNNILPFRLGEVGRAFLLSKKAGLGFLHVLSTILVERALDLALAVGLFLGSLMLVVETGFRIQAALFVGGVVVIGLVLLHLLARNQDWAIDQYKKLSGRFPFLQKIIRFNQLESFFSGLSALIDGKRFAKVVFFMVINWIVALVQFYGLLRAFFPQAELLWAAFTLSVLSLGIAAPSSPGAIGVMELSIVGALTAFNVDPSASLAAALVAHLGNYLVTGVIGIFALTRDGLSLSGIYREVREIPPSGTDTNV